MKGVILCLMGVFALTMAATPLERLDVAYNKYLIKVEEVLDYIKTLSSACAEAARRAVVYNSKGIDDYYDEAQDQMGFIRDYVARNSLSAVNQGIAKLDYFRDIAATETDCDRIF